MAADLRSIVLKMAVNALKQSRAQPQPPPEPKKPHLSTGRAVLLGAGLATAGRALVSARGRDMVGSVRDRLEEHAGHDDEEYDEPEAEDDEDFEDEESDEPEAEADEDFDDEESDEPESDANDEQEEYDEDEEVDEEELDERPRRRRARSRSR